MQELFLDPHVSKLSLDNHVQSVCYSNQTSKSDFADYSRVPRLLWPRGRFFIKLLSWARFDAGFVPIVP
jgi:hypothetical protein